MTNTQLTTPLILAKTVASFNIYEITVILNTSAQIRVQLFDTEGNSIAFRCFAMTGTDYNNWLGDDSYVVDWVKTEITNLTSL